MKRTCNYTIGQTTFLVILRTLIGWHFLYEGMVKITNPDWSSAGYLLDSRGFLSGFFHSLTYKASVLHTVDFLNEWGLILIGLGLILGLFTRFSIFAGILLLALYYLSHPPFPGISFSVPSEGSYLIVNKTLIEMTALLVLYVFPTRIGLDAVFQVLWKSRKRAAK
ncbi:MAG TPA: DoxX family membrane protein [Bacteroidetes bacterium]|nr:DoxX family membrane protein [Bacteroidota bacterium]